MIVVKCLTLSECRQSATAVLLWLTTDDFTSRGESSRLKNVCKVVQESTFRSVNRVIGNWATELDFTLKWSLFESVFM